MFQKNYFYSVVPIFYNIVRLKTDMIVLGPTGRGLPEFIIPVV